MVVFCAAESSIATKHARSPKREVAVELVSTSFSSRKLHASIAIGAPVDVVWEALTDYENLGTFIPSLVENKCLERRPQGCVLYQVGRPVPAQVYVLPALFVKDIRMWQLAGCECGF